MLHHNHTHTQRICAGIVTFNPDIELQKKNIEAIAPQLEKVYVCDNNSENILEISKLIEVYRHKAILIKLPENRGIAYALNTLCEKALTEGYDLILTLDQDTLTPLRLISVLSCYAKNNVAIVSPNIIYKNNERFSIVRTTEYDEVESTITSASLTNLKVWQQIGGFDNELFIDYVDYDFCYRAGNAGYKIIRVNKISILHELGKMKCMKIFGIVVHATNHPANRYYFMTRNMLIVKEKDKKGKPNTEITKLVLKIIFFEHGKAAKLHAVWKGLIHFRKWHKSKKRRETSN